MEKKEIKQNKKNTICLDCCALLQGDLPDPGTELTSLMSHALAGRFFTTSTTWEELRQQLLVFCIPSKLEGDEEMSVSQRVQASSYKRNSGYI